MEYIVVLINIVFSVVLVGSVMLTMIGLPGNIVIVLAAVIYGYYDQFQHVDYGIIGIVTGAFIVSEILDFGAGIIGAKKEKSSKRAILAAFLGTVLGGILGTGVLPIVGSAIGALLGAFIGAGAAEYTKMKDKEQARRVAIGVVKGQVVGMILKTTTAVTMAIILIYQLKWY